MLMSLSALVLLTSAFVVGQRPFFAGFRPIGFPETPNRTTTTQDPLGNRFGEGTTERLPIEANGDRDLIDRLSKLPLDKQPFWFINWKALEEHRKNPQTYPQRPNVFVDPIVPSSNTGSLNNRFSSPNTGFISANPENLNEDRLASSTVSNLPSANVNANADSDSNTELGNRNGFVQTTNPFVTQNAGTTTKRPQYYPQRRNNQKDIGHEYF